jgi:hypothetical protein
MENFEYLIYLLLVAGYLLFNYVTERAAKRARQDKQEQAGQPQEQDAATPPEDKAIEEVFWGSSPSAVSAPDAGSFEIPARLDAIAAAPAPPPHRRAPSALFRSQQDLRHAIVVMTVLGPCRALDPYDQRQAGPSSTPRSTA